MPGFNYDKLALLTKTTRINKKLGMRAAAIEIGTLSASTLSRIESGNIPDLETFIKLCEWMGVSPDHFVGEGNSPILNNDGLDTPQIIRAHLRADRSLNEQASEAIAAVVKAAYEAATNGEANSR